jgi:hypothetical protein
LTSTRRRGTQRRPPPHSSRLLGRHALTGSLMARQGLFVCAQEIQGVLGPGGFPAGLGPSRTKVQSNASRWPTVPLSRVKPEGGQPAIAGRPHPVGWQDGRLVVRLHSWRFSRPSLPTEGTDQERGCCEGLLHLGSSRHCKIGFARDAQR